MAQQLPEADLAAQVPQPGHVVAIGASRSTSPSATRIMATVAVKNLVIEPMGKAARRVTRAGSEFKLADLTATVTPSW